MEKGKRRSNAASKGRYLAANASAICQDERYRQIGRNNQYDSLHLGSPNGCWHNFTNQLATLIFC